MGRGSTTELCPCYSEMDFRQVLAYIDGVGINPLNNLGKIRDFRETLYQRNIVGCLEDLEEPV